MWSGPPCKGGPLLFDPAPDRFGTRPVMTTLAIPQTRIIMNIPRIVLITGVLVVAMVVVNERTSGSLAPYALLTALGSLGLATLLSNTLDHFAHRRAARRARYIG